MEVILIIAKMILFICFILYVHYSGYKFARKNPDKLYIEYWFEVDKEDAEKEVQEIYNKKL